MKRDGALTPLGAPTIMRSPNGANNAMSRNRVIFLWFLLSLCFVPCVVLSEEVNSDTGFSLAPEITTTVFGKMKNHISILLTGKIFEILRGTRTSSA